MNWATVVKEIQSEGFSQNEIATFCGCQQSHISLLNRSRTAVRAFQESVGIKIDGEVGNDTLAMLAQKLNNTTKRNTINTKSKTICVGNQKSN